MAIARDNAADDDDDDADGNRVGKPKRRSIASFK